jgi:uncharacterized membrane protein YfcA
MESEHEFYQWDQTVGICLVLFIVGTVFGAMLGSVMGEKPAVELFSHLLGVGLPLAGFILVLRHNKKYFGIWI